MRGNQLIPALITLTFLLTSPAQAAEPWSVFNINGNDTGGIIPWTPELRAYGYRDAAQHHCAGYHKLAHITSVHPRYGDYVVFACQFPRHYDPVKHGDWWYNPPRWDWLR
jgi:hypothetical protein